MSDDLFPHAVVRSDVDVAGVRSASGAAMRSVGHDGISLIGAPPTDRPPTETPEAFMDAVSDLASLAGGACVPVRASDRAMNKRESVSFLRAGRERFIRLLERLEGREEWAVCLPAAGRRATAPAASSSGRGYLEQRRRSLALADGVAPDRLEAVIEAQRRLAPYAELQRIIARAGRPSIAVLIRPENAEAIECLAEREAWELHGPYPAFSFVSLRG